MIFHDFSKPKNRKMSKKIKNEKKKSKKIKKKNENLGKNELALAATTCYLTLGKNIKEKFYILNFF